MKLVLRWGAGVSERKSNQTSLNLVLYWILVVITISWLVMEAVSEHSIWTEVQSHSRSSFHKVLHASPQRSMMNFTHLKLS